MKRPLSPFLGLLIAGAYLVTLTAHAVDPLVLPLWPDGPPTSNGLETNETTQASGNVREVGVAQLTIHHPKNPTGAVVLLLPGGGYGSVCIATEGEQILPYLLPKGITAAVLKYRLPRQGLHTIPGDDAKRAIRTLRSMAKTLDIDPTRIGIWGFSAGGHLAATLSCHGRGGDPDSPDPIERLSARPDFSILFYPVISMTQGVTHGGSRRNLLGESPTEKWLRHYSLETQVEKTHPPAFLLHAADDRAVPIANSLKYVAALAEAKVEADLHVYAKGNHGPGAFRKNPSWESAFDEWLTVQGALPKQ